MIRNPQKRKNTIWHIMSLIELSQPKINLSFSIPSVCCEGGSETQRLYEAAWITRGWEEGEGYSQTQMRYSARNLAEKLARLATLEPFMAQNQSQILILFTS